MAELVGGSEGRRAEVLDAALRTFSRFGYRKTSMDDIAASASISRPGLYFLFTSKAALFCEAAERGVGLDLLAAERALSDTNRPLDDRLLDALDAWAGRYVGPLGDTTLLVEENPELLGPIARGGPTRFEALLTAAIEQNGGTAEPQTVAATLVSLSIGVKHQSSDRAAYRARMAAAIPLFRLG